ncbi:DUF3378 domain-containing protein [Candidatus Micrarchaeota archaeon]|nr:DUF3378 domain-containing protein [Candidatus Micrarchaeota archaeon]MBU1930761.1 DUF3378 domain-containing protein [Candidatus Micrarchaeota archaeon]
MQAVLNYKKQELPVLRAFLQKFDQQPPQQFEVLRCRIQACSVALFASGKLLIQGTNAEKVKKLVLDSVSLGNELVLGFDETGRGEDFGDFCIAGVLGKTKELRELRDSKKISNLQAKKKIVEKKCVSSVVVCYPAPAIDALREKGITLNQIEADVIDWITDFFVQVGFKPDQIILDGNPLPVQSKQIVFLPKADDIEPVVGAASVLAKCAREESGSQEKRKTWKQKKD